MPRRARSSDRETDWKAALRARVADAAPALRCVDGQLAREITLPVRHIIHAPATPAALERLRRLPPRVLKSLEPVWSVLDGGRFCALGDGYARSLVELHPIAAMTSETQAWHDSLFALDDDPDGLLDALVIGGAQPCANCFVVATTGKRAGQILLFDHESLRAEPYATTASDLVGQIVRDPLAVARALGSDIGLGETGQASALAYLSAGAGL